MHATENLWMGATGSMDTPLHHKAYEMIPVHANCSGGWVRLREGDSQGFVYMVSPSMNDSSSEDWVIKIGSNSVETSLADPQYHFLLEDEGYILNRGAMAFINVLAEAEYPVRGHSGGYNRKRAAGREYGAYLHFQLVCINMNILYIYSFNLYWI